MAFNQAINYLQGYVSSNGNIGGSDILTGANHISGIVAGIQGLALRGSTHLAGVCTDRNGNIYTDTLTTNLPTGTEENPLYISLQPNENVAKNFILQYFTIFCNKNFLG